jgi:hypothetical protein
MKPHSGSKGVIPQVRGFPVVSSEIVSFLAGAILADLSRRSRKKFSNYKNLSFIDPFLHDLTVTKKRRRHPSRFRSFHRWHYSSKHGTAPIFRTMKQCGFSPMESQPTHKLMYAPSLSLKTKDHRGRQVIQNFKQGITKIHF